ncbi:type III polyketide synthase [Wenxinia saemankumensis]|uniref:(2-(2,4-dihydroxy-6-methylphenyl)-2-oxoethyl)-4-hydroxy-2-pyrone synthase n=1 Tax=Wenxinia saemankumensis TaxID=1447782 RepID=A0A1M6H2C9_9RHOB|nr:3-oxoacyl-[acyl-carrier-protein] synthase III C-terminal domain-containing protein [Wenxinia saemankumensis]SHJ16294.1 (2-(2,4-dihydroxy-6-methylphenyl)-2-oxoethyl)-4-hydroxy-2-pyrone synthase [Wenxinia saemankumensis]
MLDRLSPAAPRTAPRQGAGPVFDVTLAGIGTAVPPHALPQDLVQRTAARLLGPRYPQFERLRTAFDNAGVDIRYSVVPPDWFEGDHGWSDRNAAYLAGATALFRDAATRALTDAGIAAEEVDTIVSISSTGIATPSLEAQVHAEMGFRRDVRRVPVFGLGCAGGVTGLAIARRLAAADPGSRVLMVAVEACSLSFRTDRLQKADIIATVLFGDGAAAAVLQAGGEGRVRLAEGHEHLWPDTLPIMGWDVDDTALGVIFDRSIPEFAAAEFRNGAEAMLSAAGLASADLDRLVCHPGGAKVVEAIEAAMELPPGTLGAERRVLRKAGNMSAPTALFVLEEVLEEGLTGTMALTALGPGFTASLIPMQVG